VRSKPTQPGLLSSTLLNISAVHLQQQQHGACVQYAAAAAAVDAHSVKAHYRCALALRALQQPAAALYCCQQAAAVTATATAAASYNEISTLLSELQRECSASKVQAADSAEALARVLAVTVCDSAHSTAEVAAVAVDTAATVVDTTVSYDAERAAHSKAAGNAHFAKGEYCAALTCYHTALSHLQPAAVLLSNRAAVHLQSGQHAAALNDAVAAVKVDAALAKGHYRRVQALLGLQLLNEAAIACEQGLSSATASANTASRSALLTLQKRISAANASAAAAAAAAAKRSCTSSSSSGSSTKPDRSSGSTASSKSSGNGSSSGTVRGLTEREQHDYIETTNGKAPWQSAAVFRSMLTMLPEGARKTAALQALGVDPTQMASMPQFHRDFAAGER
jgi:tetratricopeptide (TPR) repeat protein